MKALKALATGVLMTVAASPADAKARSEAAITIHAPIETVWGLVVAIDNWPKWNKAVSRARLEGPLAIGSSFRWTSGGLGIRSTFREIVPMRRLAWTGQTLGTNAVHAWTFKTTEAGVVVTTTETFDGWLPTIMPRTMQRTLDQTLPALLASLKAAAEQHPGAR